MSDLSSNYIVGHTNTSVEIIWDENKMADEILITPPKSQIDRLWEQMQNIREQLNELTIRMNRVDPPFDLNKVSLP